MVSFVYFARIASLWCGFSSWYIAWLLFYKDFWPNLSSRLEYQVKLVLNSRKIFERGLLSSDSIAKSATQKPWVFSDWTEALDKL